MVQVVTADGPVAGSLCIWEWRGHIREQILCCLRDMSSVFA